MRFQSLLFLIIFSVSGCKNADTAKCLDDLSSIKEDFLQSIFQENVDESPFHMGYKIRTTLFSRDVVSLFGELFVYDHLPHGWSRYEGKTFCKIDGRLQEITLDTLFATQEQKEFLRSYCENGLKNTYGNLTYLVGENPLLLSLPQDSIYTFVVDARHLIIVFQPYSVGGCIDGPFVVKIPYTSLEGHWNPTNPLRNLIPKVISSRSFTSCWDEEIFHTTDESATPA